MLPKELQFQQDQTVNRNNANRAWNPDGAGDQPSSPNPIPDSQVGSHQSQFEHFRNSAPRKLSHCLSQGQNCLSPKENDGIPIPSKDNQQPTMGQSVPEELYPMERAHTGAGKELSDLSLSLSQSMSLSLDFLFLLQLRREG